MPEQCLFLLFYVDAKFRNTIFKDNKILATIKNGSKI